MTAPEPDDLVLAAHAVLRVAAWPLESVAGFAAPELRASMVQAARHTDRLRDRSEALADSLADAVPAAEPHARRWLLAARRALHGGRATAAAPVDIGGDARLAPLIADVDALGCERAAHERDVDRLRAEHDRVYARQLEHLRAVAGDDRFLKAMVVDKPQVAERWRAALAKGVDNRARTRRLHATVFRHLMGAAGRPTPRLAWAGVVPVVPAAEPGLHVDPAPAVFDVAPALEPFAVVLERWSAQLAGTPTWPLRRAPTLIEDPDGWLHEGRGTRFGWERTDPSAARRAVLSFWTDGQSRPPAPLLDFSYEANGSDARRRIAGVVHELVATGVLVNGASLPVVATDCWQALDSVTPLLPAPVSAIWAATVEQVRRRCDDLARNLAGATVGEILEARAGIVATVRALWTSAGLSASPPEPTVHVDMVGPWRARWGQDTRSEIAGHVAAVLSRLSADGTAEQLRRAASAGLPTVARHPGAACLTVSAAMTGPHLEAPSTVGEMLARRSCDPAPLEAQWEAELGHHHHLRRYDLTARRAGPGIAHAGPVGSMVFTGARSPWVRWGRPQLGLFSTRHLSLLETVIGPGPAAEHLAMLQRVEAVQVWGSDPVRRSTAMRPVAADRLTPHGGPAESLSDVSVEIDDADRVWFRRGRSGPLQRPVYDAAAAIGRHDPASRLLLTAAMSHGWELMAWGVPITSAELHRWHHLPRLSLSDGPVLSAERWLIPQDVVRRLTLLDGADRFLGWCREVDRRALPSLALVRCGLDPSAPELLFPTDSPLSVSAVFDRLPADGCPLVLTEVPTDGRTLVVDDAGDRYIAELAVTWVWPEPR